MEKSKRNFYPLYFLIPALFLYTLIKVIPTAVTFATAFTNWTPQRFEFVGLLNFKIQLSDRQIAKALANTMIFTGVTTAGKMVFGMLLALLLQKNFLTTGYTRTVFYAPSVVNNVAVATAFLSIMHPSTGLLNRALAVFGITGAAWLTNPSLSIYSVSMVEIWKWVGYCAMFFIAGLQSISNDIYEAVEIDGAGKWKKFWKVTFPMMLPTINSVFVLNIIGGLSVFEMPKALKTPGYIATTVNQQILMYMSDSKYGLASSGILMWNIISMSIALIFYKQITRREVEI